MPGMPNSALTASSAWLSLSPALTLAITLVVIGETISGLPGGASSVKLLVMATPGLSWSTVWPAMANTTTECAAFWASVAIRVKAPLLSVRAVGSPSS